MGISGSDRQKNLANVDTGDGAIGLAPSTSHTSLKSIGAGTGQHLVDTDDVVRMSSDSEMETFFAGNLDKVPSILLDHRRHFVRIFVDVLVGANTGSFEGF